MTEHTSSTASELAAQGAKQPGTSAGPATIYSVGSYPYITRAEAEETVRFSGLMFAQLREQFDVASELPNLLPEDAKEIITGLITEAESTLEAFDAVATQIDSDTGEGPDGKEFIGKLTELENTIGQINAAANLINDSHRIYLIHLDDLETEI